MATFLARGRCFTSAASSCCWRSRFLSELLLARLGQGALLDRRLTLSRCRQLLPELVSRGETLFVITPDDRYFHLADRVVKLEYGQVVSQAASSEEARAGDAGRLNCRPARAGRGRWQGRGFKEIPQT
jgi:hypothetical protein